MKGIKAISIGISADEMNVNELEMVELDDSGGGGHSPKESNEPTVPDRSRSRDSYSDSRGKWIWPLRKSTISSLFALGIHIYIQSQDEVWIVFALYFGISTFILYVLHSSPQGTRARVQNAIMTAFLLIFLVSISNNAKFSSLHGGLSADEMQELSNAQGLYNKAPTETTWRDYTDAHKLTAYLLAKAGIHDLHRQPANANALGNSANSAVADREKALIALTSNEEDRRKKHAGAVNLRSSAKQANAEKTHDKNVAGEFEGLSVSIIIPAKYESEYMVKTLMYLYDITPFALIEETIVIDDASETPLEPLIEEAMLEGLIKHFTDAQKKSIKVIRNDHRQGLIRSKIQGGNAAVGTHIFFLDGHCRPFLNWLEPMLHRSLGNYKRIVVPTIPDVEGSTWKKKPNVGIKMMFTWNFHFDWFDDSGDDVPILSGGLLLMTKKWWIEGGGYDDGMLEWGGENIEQSLRCWMCGGEIVVERASQVGHIFHRPQPPNKVAAFTLPRNKARAGYVWLDDYYQYFADSVPVVRELDLGNFLLERMLFRLTYGCKKFTWWLHRFQNVFEEQGLIVDRQHHVRHSVTGLCLEGRGTLIEVKPCDPLNPSQQWGFINHRRRIVNGKQAKCIDQGNNVNAKVPILYKCDRTMSNMNQIWRFTNENDPPLQKDRNFNDDAVFPGQIINYFTDPANLHAGQLKDPDYKLGRCLVVEPSPSKGREGEFEVHMTICTNADLEKAAHMFDIIW